MKSKCCNADVISERGNYCSNCGLLCDIKKPPTNEPKMPMVIYAHDTDIPMQGYNGHWAKHKSLVRPSFQTPYHHDDKVQELRQALRDLLLYWNNPCVENKHKEALLTKASNLLK